MSTVVFQYGLLDPTDQVELIDAEILGAHNYYNKLVGIELAYRRAKDAFLSSHAQIGLVETQIEECQTALSAARKALNGARATARSRQAGDPTLCKNLSHRLQELHKTRIKSLQELRADPLVADVLRDLDDKRKAEMKAARATCGVYWGTYVQVEAAFDQARKSKGAPAFKKWIGAGSVSMQLRRLFIACASACKNRSLQLDLIPQAIPGREGKALPRLRVRIGSREKSRPIFGEWPIVYHRPLPEDAEITWVRVSRNRVGSHAEWKAYFTVNMPDAVAADAQAAAVAVDLHWLSSDESNTVTVAEWGSDRRRGKLDLDPAVVQAVRKCDSLRSIRDREFELAKEHLSQALTSGVLPVEHLAHLETLPHWKAPKKLVHYVIWWGKARFPGDESLYSLLESWRKKDKHLWDWEANGRRKALARRLDNYRTFAAQLAREHECLVIDALNIAPLARIPAPEDDQYFNPVANSLRSLGAPSELRLALINAFRRLGKRVVECPPGLSIEEMLPLAVPPDGGPACAASSDRVPSVRLQRMQRGKTIKATSRP